MTRGSASSSSKRQGLHSNTHIHNHSGLVPPKRSGRSRSSSSVANVSVAPLTANQPSTQEAAAATAQFHPAVNGNANSDITNGWHAKGPAQKYYDCLGDDVENYEGVSSAISEHKIDLDPCGKGTLDALPSTVLTSFPLLDTITLLIIFLQIPSTILTVIHFLFFLQTFVPPSTTIFSISTTTSLPSFTNLLLQGSNGSPSLLTIMFADCIVASVSLVLWPAAWSFLVDFAQATIAVSLGAGNSNGGSLRNMAMCAGVMGGVKTVQGRFRLSDAWDSIQPSREHTTSQMFLGRVENAGWIRTFFAIHIVAQAAMRATRRWLIRRPDSGEGVSVPLPNHVKDGPSKQKDKDPEAAAGAPPQPTLERENSVGGGKKKKKSQAQNIRSNQPLWATVASAIIHVAKEVERSQLSSEASVTNVGAGGSALSESTPGSDDSSIWITRIGSTEIGFVVGFRGMKGEDGYGYVVSGGIDATGRDSSFPFFVRVNGIVWPQTHIYPLAPGSEAEVEVESDEGEQEWAVDVTGLTGSTEYDFEFVKREGGIFYSTSACTLPAQTSTVPSVKHQPSRPLSPTTTLLHSLTQAKSSLIETKSNLKALRKAHKNTLSELRKEIERHRGLIGNDRGEERAFRRNLALRESIKRAEEESEEMASQLTSLERLPTRTKSEWNAKKKTWQVDKKRLLVAQTKATEEKSNADRQATAVVSESASLSAKKDKLSARLSKLRVDLGKLDSENSDGSDTKEKKLAEREAIEKHRESREKEYLTAIQRREIGIRDYTLRSHQNWSAYYALETAALQQQHTPSPADVLSGGGVVVPPGFPSYPAANMPHINSRERSSSLFSDGSVITNVSELGDHAGFEPAFEPVSVAMVGGGAKRMSG